MLLDKPRDHRVVLRVIGQAAGRDAMDRWLGFDLGLELDPWLVAHHTQPGRTKLDHGDRGFAMSGIVAAGRLATLLTTAIGLQSRLLAGFALWSVAGRRLAVPPKAGRFGLTTVFADRTFHVGCTCKGDPAAPSWGGH